MTVVLEASDTTLDEVLAHAAKGDQVHLLQAGQTVATVNPETSLKFPPPTPEQTERACAALVRIDERAKRLGLKFDFAEFKADVEYGRR